MRHLETLSWFLALTALTWAQSSYYGAGKEIGQINARLQNQVYNQGASNLGQKKRDSNRFDGNAEQQAKWAGQSAVKENALAQNEKALQQRAQLANQNFGRSANSFGDIAKQIRDEALRNQYVFKDDAQYRRNDVNSAEGANQANARKTAYDVGELLDDNINYAFNKKFDKAASENGGYEEENGRNLKKLDLIDEREKDRKLLRGDTAVVRKQADQASQAKDEAWLSNANQRQAQDGKYGFADRRVDQAGERSDDRAVDYDRKDSRYLEQETGRDQAVRLAKDLAAKEAAYQNEAAATADANRNVADKKYFGGKEVGQNAVLTGAHTGYGPEDATAAALGVNGDKAKQEGSGGVIKTGFDENAAQTEKGNELAAAKALSSAAAVNDYQRNKDKLAYDQVQALQDRTQGQFKQGLQDAASQGFAGNNAEAAKSAAQWDKAAAASTSASDLQAAEKSENEGLRDRDYARKLQNDDSETFSRRKQFYHNKKEGGNNDENLLYNRQKNARNFGAADEADLSKQNNFQNYHQDGKVSNQNRNFEDLVDRRNVQQHEKEGQVAQDKGFDNKENRAAAQAVVAADGYNKGATKVATDDSQSTGFNSRQSLQDEDDLASRSNADSSQHAKAVAANIQYVRPTNGNPLGDIKASDFIGQDVLTAQATEKGPKHYDLPDLVVDIKPIHPPTKVELPKQPQPLPPVPDVTPVKLYIPPKYNKQDVNYDTGNPTGRAYERPTFSRLDNLDLFRGPKAPGIEPKQQQSPKARFSLQAETGPATASFGRNLLDKGGLGRGPRGPAFGRR